MFSFGKKKDQPASNKPSAAGAAAAQPTGSGNAPQAGGDTYEPVVPGGNSVDMFGGMAPKARRKRGQTTVDAGEQHGAGATSSSSTTTSAAVEEPARQPPAPQAAAAATEPPKPAAEEQPKPFFSRFELTSGATPEDEDEPADLKRMRRRLERFYEEHNPSKLSQVEQTLKSYAGREKELFEALVQKYGPEPAAAPSSGATTATTPPSATEAPRANSDAHIGSDNSVMGADAASNPFGIAAGDGGGGFGDDVVGGAGDGGGWSATDVGGATGFTFGDDAAGNGGATGFSFGDPQPSALGDAARLGGGFSFVPTLDEAVIVRGEGNEAVGGFQFAVSDATADADNAAAAPSSAFWGSADTTTTITAAALPVRPEASDDDEPTLNERHRAEMRDKQGDVLLAKSDLASDVAHLAGVLQKRRETVSQYHALEREIELCIAAEEFEKADQLNSEMESLSERMDELDLQERELVQRLPSLADAVKRNVVVLSSVFRSQRQELLQCKSEEERRVNKFITETASRLDTESEKLAASLDRANRTLHNTEQEVVNIEQRNQKIQDKISEQTRGLRETHAQLTSEKETLDAEIRDLEQKLQQKRRQSADKKLQISELEEKLSIIMAGFAGTADEVSRQLQEETAKRKAAQQVVDELTREEQQLSREQKSFAEERELMLRGLEQNAVKIDRYDALADELEQQVPSEFDAFVRDALTSVLAQRTVGRAFLVEAPHHADNDGGAASPEAPTSPTRSRSPTTAPTTPQQALVALQAERRHLERDLQAARAADAANAVRLQEIRQHLPLLEAAKKTAAQAKQFKEAQTKTEEIKRCAEEISRCEADATAAATKIRSITERLERLEVDIASAQAQALAHMTSFLQSYRDALARTVRSVPRTSCCVNLLRLNPEEGSTDADDLASALHALYEELLCEVSRLPGGDLSTEGADCGTTTRNNNNNNGATATEERAVDDATQTNSSAADGPSAGIERTEVDEESEPTMSVEELQSEIASLERALESAMDDEDYTRCEEIQTKLDSLQAMLPR